MKRTILIATALTAILVFAASRAQADFGYAPIELAKHHNHHYGHYHGHRDYYRAPVIVQPRVYAYPTVPSVVVPAYPPTYVVPADPCYGQPRPYIQYRGRGLSLGIGL